MTIQIPTLDFLAILPQLVLVGMALLILMAEVTRLRGHKRLLGGLALAGLLLALGASAWLWQGPARHFQNMVVADSTALFANVIILTAGALGVLLSVGYIERISDSVGEYYALLLLACAGMTLMSASTSLMTIFMSLEILSVALYIMTGFNLKQPRSTEAALKYFLLGAFASAFFLYGAALVYAATQTTDLVQVAHFLAPLSTPSPMAPLLPVGVGLLLIGFGFKVAMVPFHMWTPDVYQGAPTPVTAFMSVGVKTAAFAALLRVLASLTSFDKPWLWVIAILAVLTMTVGNLAALRQSSLKRMLAYSSIAHAGYILVGLTGNNDQAVGATLYYLFAYAFMNIGAFAVLQTLENNAEMDVDVSAPNGLGRRQPALAAVMTIFMLSLAGIPPLAGFFGKLYVFKAAVDAGWTWLVIVAVLNSALSAYYYLRVTVNMFLGSETASGQIVLTPAWNLALIVASVGTVLVGVWPTPWMALARTTLLALVGG